MSRPTGAVRSPGRWPGWHVAPTAGKLTQRHREVARADPAFEQALRRQTKYPERIDALIAGGTYFVGKPCERCGSVKRRVFDCGCWSCKRQARPWIPDQGIPKARHSRDGWLDRLERQRRERTGEYVSVMMGDWKARQYPTGRLAVSCEKAHVRGYAPDGRPLPSLPACPYLASAPHGTEPETLAFDCLDLIKVAPAVLYGLADRNPDFLAVLRWAGWVD